MRFFATVSFFLLFLHPVPAQENEHRDLDPFTVNITAELFQKNPDAAKLFARANAARDEERFEEAETLYTKVLEMEPDFYHATRRLASVAHSLGRRAEAIQLSRKALQQEKTSYNLYMLLMTLYGRDMEVELNKAELDEAGGLARKIVNDPDVDGDLLPLVCYTATQLEDLNLLRDCSLLAQQ